MRPLFKTVRIFYGYWILILLKFSRKNTVFRDDSQGAHNGIFLNENKIGVLYLSFGYASVMYYLLSNFGVVHR